MTITIYGAGAIGGLAGAYLAKAGEDVLLVDKVGRARRRHQPRTASGSPAPPSSPCPFAPAGATSCGARSG